MKKKIFLFIFVVLTISSISSLPLPHLEKQTRDNVTYNVNYSAGSVTNNYYNYTQNTTIVNNFTYTGNPFDQVLNTTSNVTFDRIILANGSEDYPSISFLGDLRNGFHLRTTGVIDANVVNQFRIDINNQSTIYDFQATKFLPSPTNTNSLGFFGYAWSNLYLGTLGKIIFNEGALNLSHSTNQLKLEGGNFSATGNISTDNYFVGDGRFLTNVPTINTSYYLNSNPYGYLNTTINTSYYLANNPFGFYNSTTLPASLTGAGSFGYIPKWNGTSSLNNSLLYQSVNTLGLGSTSLADKFYINDTDATSNSGGLSIISRNGWENGYLALSLGSGGRPFIIGQTNLSLGDANNNEILFIENSKIGIGTTTPSSNLHIEGSASQLKVVDSSTTSTASQLLNLTSLSTNTGSDARIEFGLMNSTNQTNYAEILALRDSLNSNGIGLLLRPINTNGALVNAISIEPEGVVSIGFTNPKVANFEVLSNLSTSDGTASNYMGIADDYRGTGNNAIFSDDNYYFYKGSQPNGYFNASSSVQAGTWAFTDDQTATGTTLCYTTAGAYHYIRRCSSSENLKSNIQDYTINLSRLASLSPKTYTHYDGSFEGGLLAQDVSNVFPEFTVYDFENKTSTSKTPFNVRYDKLATLSVIELAKKNLELEDKLNKICLNNPDLCK